MTKNRRWLLKICAVMSLTVALTSTRAENGFTAAPLPAAPGPERSTKLALLVGINEYRSAQISPLAGSINDVEDMFQVLTTKFEFRPENIKVLKNAEATHANIIDAIRNHLIAKARPGDIVVFHFSGHGSQMKDVTGKKISGLDETIVPNDSRDPQGKVFDISGAELHGLLLQLMQKTKNVTMILDSCHSGTLFRDINGARVRSIPEDKRTPPPPPSYAVGTTRGLGSSDPGAPLKYAFIAAATSRESAYEHLSEGKDHGALTYFLARQLRSARAGATYRDVMDSVIGNVTANYPAQHPQLEGTEADQYVFGDSGSIAGTYVTVSPLDARRVKLGIGQVEGATSGSVYEVYPPGARKFAPPEQPVARIQITKVDAFESEASIVSGKVSPASRAVERSHNYGKARMRVYLNNVDASPVLGSIRDALQPYKYIEIVTSPALCNLQLREAKGAIETLGADSTTLEPPMATNNPIVVRQSVERVRAWAKYFNVLSIHNFRSGIDLQFTLKASQTRDPMARVGKPDMGVWAGESIEAIVQNNSERDLYIAILDLSSDGSVNVVYPQPPGGQEVLTPGSTMTRKFNTFVSKGHTRATDILKVFASQKPIDLSPLQQGAIRGPSIGGQEPDPLRDLLEDSVGSNSRGVAAAPQALNLGTWATQQRVLLVKSKSRVDAAK
jgi:uncharacterized caspase-like protein